MSHDPTKSKSAPAEAFRFTAECRFAAGDDRSVDGGSMPIELLARTGNPVEHWYWGRIVHDFAGMANRDRIALDYRHDDDELIGYADKFETSTGDLVLSGQLVSLDSKDRAAEVFAKGKAGVPYEASIDFRGGGVYEWLPENMTAEVNGRPVTGPCVIARQWRLRGCAICAHGVDSDTESRFSADVAGKEQLTVPIKWKDGSMPITNDPAQLVADKAAVEKLTADKLAAEKFAADKETAEKAALAAQAATAAKLAADSRSQLKSYMDKFGAADGAQYFADGLNLEASLDKHVAKLSADKAAADKRADDAETKLKQLNLGEDEGIAIGGKATGAKAKTFESLFVKTGSQAK